MRILPWVHRWHSSSWCWLRSSEKHILTPEEQTRSVWREPWRRRWRSRRRRRAARCWCTCSRGQSPSRSPSRLCHRSRILVPCRNTHKHIPVDIGWNFFLVLKIILKEKYPEIMSVMSWNVFLEWNWEYSTFIIPRVLKSQYLNR